MSLKIKSLPVKSTCPLVEKSRNNKILSIYRTQNATVSTLNTILKNKDEITSMHESNLAAAKRVRLANSRVPLLHEKLYGAFSHLRSKNVELSTKDVTKS